MVTMLQRTDGRIITVSDFTITWTRNGMIERTFNNAPKSMDFIVPYSVLMEFCSKEEALSGIYIETKIILEDTSSVSLDGNFLVISQSYPKLFKCQWIGNNKFDTDALLPSTVVYRQLNSFYSNYGTLTNTQRQALSYFIPSCNSTKIYTKETTQILPCHPIALRLDKILPTLSGLVQKHDFFSRTAVICGPTKKIEPDPTVDQFKISLSCENPNSDSSYQSNWFSTNSYDSTTHYVFPKWQITSARVPVYLKGSWNLSSETYNPYSVPRPADPSLPIPNSFIPVYWIPRLKFWKSGYDFDRTPYTSLAAWDRVVYNKGKVEFPVFALPQGTYHIKIWCNCSSSISISNWDNGDKHKGMFGVIPLRYNIMSKYLFDVSAFYGEPRPEEELVPVFNIWYEKVYHEGYYDDDGVWHDSWYEYIEHKEFIRMDTKIVWVVDYFDRIEAFLGSAGLEMVNNLIKKNPGDYFWLNPSSCIKDINGISSGGSWSSGEDTVLEMNFSIAESDNFYALIPQLFFKNGSANKCPSFNSSNVRCYVEITPIPPDTDAKIEQLTKTFNYGKEIHLNELLPYSKVGDLLKDSLIATGTLLDISEDHPTIYKLSDISGNVQTDDEFFGILIPDETIYLYKGLARIVEYYDAENVKISAYDMGKDIYGSEASAPKKITVKIAADSVYDDDFDIDTDGGWDRFKCFQLFDYMGKFIKHNIFVDYDPNNMVSTYYNNLTLSQAFALNSIETSTHIKPCDCKSLSFLGINAEIFRWAKGYKAYKATLHVTVDQFKRLFYNTIQSFSVRVYDQLSNSEIQTICYCESYTLHDSGKIDIVLVDITALIS